eukprot:TRINITY_DN14828_c0_g1_i1.p1 TRINITY_DN14828_c0_g1~~TRINITY_DN14828_c0_g1_i1.p1  ORF type:complete len:341 (-),score=29.99 TRINITY_DN14828_c0_g1_i1:33-1055(-)
MISTVFGFIALLFTCFAFGSNFVPVKRFETGDGVFFQWLMCCGIWCSGFVIYAIRSLPPFEALPMLGGFLWCTGNMLITPMISLIGLSMALLLLGMANLIMGWCSGHFGFFGLKPNVVPNPALNYAGLALSLVSTVLIVFIKPTVEKVKDAVMIPDSEQALSLSYPKPLDQPFVERAIADRLSPLQRHVLGCVLSLICGSLFGISFDPPQWLADHNDHPVESIDYAFSFYTGIFLTSSMYMMIYSLVNKNKPALYPQLVFPGFVAGVLWAIGEGCFFLASNVLSFVVTFPIVSMGPGLVGIFWGVFVFREIRGLKNYMILVVVLFITAGAVVCIAFSLKE